MDVEENLVALMQKHGINLPDSKVKEVVERVKGSIIRLEAIFNDNAEIISIHQLDDCACSIHIKIHGQHYFC